MRKKKTSRKDERIGKIKIIPDFLPPSKKLILKQKTIKVIIPLTKETLDYFKKEAKTQHTQYQRIIKTLLDQYVDSKHGK